MDRTRTGLLFVVTAVLVAAVAGAPQAQDKGGARKRKSQEELPGARFDPGRMQKLNEDPSTRVERVDPSTLDPNARSGGADDAAGAPLTEPPAGAAPVEAPAFAGTPLEGLREIERLARAGKGLHGAALADDLMTRLPDDRRNEPLIAELRYARGVAASMAGQRDDAVRDFRSAGALAGPGELRRDALYNAAVDLLEEAQVLFEEIPEIAAQELAKDPLVKNSQIGKGADTLPGARRKYTEAREVLLDRLRLDWRDADTRANLELAQRRLEHIARIEERRDEPTTDKKSEEGKETEQTKEGDQGEQGDQESEEKREEDGETGRNPDSETERAEDADPQPGEGGQEGDQMPDPEAEAEEDATQPKLEEQEDGEENEELTSESGGAELDMEMSPEEVRMVLDRLNQIDENARRLRTALMRTRMIQVERDW